MARNDEKREMVVPGADGNLEDEDLWAEILGEDTHNTWDVNREPPAAQTQSRK